LVNSLIINELHELELSFAILYIEPRTCTRARETKTFILTIDNQAVTKLTLFNIL